MGFFKTRPAPRIANVQGRRALALGKAFAGLSLLKVLGISFLRFAVKGDHELGGWRRQDLVLSLFRRPEA